MSKYNIQDAVVQETCERVWVCLFVGLSHDISCICTWLDVMCTGRLTKLQKCNRRMDETQLSYSLLMAIIRTENCDTVLLHATLR